VTLGSGETAVARAQTPPWPDLARGDMVALWFDAVSVSVSPNTGRDPSRRRPKARRKPMPCSQRGSGLAVTATILLALAAPAWAGDPVDVAAAKQEGKVVWYTSTPIATANKIVKAFESETGVKVELFRSGGSAVIRRFMQEQQAGLHAADLLTASDPAAIAVMARKGMFVPFRPTNFDKVPPAARDPNGAYVAQRVNLITIYFRSDKIADAPKSWSDLLDPKYKGQMVTTDPSYTALGLMTVATLAKQFGWGFYEKLRAADTMVVQGNQQVDDMIKNGERLIAAGASDSYAAHERKAGHPFVTVYPSEGALIIASPTAVVKGSPHLNAAKLLAEFMLSDTAQKFFPEDGGHAARVDIAGPAGSPKLADVKTLAIDYDAIEKESAQVKRKFAEIFQ
jgi:iron(III) transport system substrate-binding protein